MKKRFTRFLSCLLVFVLVIPFFCVTSHAVLPLGFAQSVLASYVASTGYKMWQDEAVGDSILQSLATLYSDKFLPESGLDEVSLSQFALQSLLDANRIGMDNSGNVVVSKMAADVFQQFADWIQTEYSVPVGSDQPTTVVPASAGTDFTLANGAIGIVSYPGSVALNSIYGAGRVGRQIGVYNSSYPLYWWSVTSSPTYLVRTSNKIYFMNNSSGYLATCYLKNGSYDFFGIVHNATAGSWVDVDLYSISSFNLSMIPLSSVAPDGSAPSVTGSVAGLGVSLAQDIVDQAAKAQDDDAVVIGVGAQAGATAQEIADLIAQGINARTLDPTITITAEAVIDTPVQPYPDVDGLGLPTLGAALVSRFPFCVPWDFVDTLRVLNADPIPPVFDVTLVPASVASRWGVTGNYTLHVDLTSAEYAKLFTALRWGTLVGFCLGLALLTKRLIWTA